MSSVSEDDYFLGDYIDWRNKRISMMINILGDDFFKDKTVLELGCGYGYIGNYLQQELGSIVTFAEGNENFISKIKQLNPNSDVIHLDQDKPYNLNKKI